MIRKMNKVKVPGVFCLLFIASSVWGQNGKILLKTHVRLSAESFWKNITEEGILKANYQYLDSLNFYEITYLSDSIPVKGYIVEPKTTGKYPVILFNRGGNRNFAPLNLATLVNYTSKLAAAGYVIIGSNYREKDEFGGADINDVLALFQTIKELNQCDSNRIGMLGWSRGGMMTYLTLKHSKRLKTAVVGNGPTDLFRVIEDRPEMETKVFESCIPHYAREKEAELKKRSAIFWADKLNRESSLLILCGTNDEQVNPEQARSMALKLDEINFPYELKCLETDHFFSDKKNELNRILIEWFNKELKIAGK